MTEWSKALVLGTSHFDGVGSNPTAARNFSSNHFFFLVYMKSIRFSVHVIKSTQGVSFQRSTRYSRFPFNLNTLRYGRKGSNNKIGPENIISVIDSSLICKILFHLPACFMGVNYLTVA